MVEKIDYKLIADTALDWEYLINSEGKFFYCSPSCQKITGYSREDFLANRDLFFQIVHPENQNIFQPKSNLEKQEGHTAEIELQITKKDGSEAWLSHACHPVFTEDGKFIGLRGCNRDISKRKEIQKIHEADLKKNEEKYRLLVENSGIGIGVYDLNGKIIFFNQQAIKHLGGKVEDYIGKSLTEILGEEAGSKYIKRIQLVANLKTNMEFEDYVQLPTANYWFLSVHSKILNSDGNVIGIQVIAHDITERKLAEQNLMNSQEKYKTLFNRMKEGVFYQSSDGTLIDVNEAALNMFGIDREEFLSRTSSAKEWKVIDEKGKIVTTQNHPSVVALNTGEPIIGKMLGVFNPTKNSYTWIEISAIPQFQLGETRPSQVFVTLHDLTERKQLEITLEKNEEMFRLMTERSQELVCIHDLDGTYNYVSPSVKKILGYSPEELWGTDPVVLIHPDDKNRIIEKNNKLLILGTTNVGVEYRIKKKEGEYLWFETFSNHVKNSNGEIIGLQTSSRDISLRKKAEEELAAETNLLQSLMNHIPDHIYFKDSESRFLRVNKSQWQDFGINDANEIIGKTDFEYFTHEHASQALADEKRIIETSQPLISIEEKETWHSGLVKWVSTTKLPLHDSSGNIIGTFGISRDITETKNIAEKLRESENKLRSIFDTINEGIALNEIIYNSDGEMIDYRILEVNNAFYSVADFSTSDIIGNVASEVYGMTSEYIKEFWKQHKNKFDTQQTEMLSPISNKWFLVSTSPFINNKFVTTFNDISERKNAEEGQKLTIEILRILNNASSKENLIESIVAFLKANLKCDAVGIRLKEEEDFPYFETSGFSESFVKAEKYLCSYNSNGEIERDNFGNPILDCMCGNILCGRFDPSYSFFTEHGSFWSNSTTELLATTSDADRRARTRNRCNGEGYESVGLFPLRFGGEPFGLLQVNHKKKNLFTPLLLSILERLADNLAISLSNHLVVESLKKSEEKHHLLFDNSVDGIFYSEPRGQIFSANKAACEILGMTEAMICNASRDGIMDQTDPRLKAALNERKKKGYFSGELTYIRANGDKFPAELTSVLFKDKNGNERANTIFRDISERKRNEERILSYASTLNSIFENTPYMMMLVDEDAKVININQEGLEFARNVKANIYGHLAGEVLNCISSFQEPGCGKNLDCVSCPIRSSVNYTFNTKESVHSGEGRMSFEVNGNIVNLDLLISTTLVKQNKKDSVLLSIIDLTERKKAEDALKKSEAKYRTIFETASEGILVADINENIISVNQQMALIIGYSSGELTGKNFKDLIPVEDIEDHFEKKKNRKANLGDVYERRLLKKDNSIIWCLVSASPTYDEKGNYSGAFGMFTDITERKNIEETTKLQRDFNYSLVSARSLEDAATIILYYCKHISGIECGALFLVDELGGLKSVGSFGFSEKFQKYFKYHSPESLEAEMGKKGTAFFLNFSEMKMNGITSELEEGIKSIIALPLLKDGKVFSLLILASKILEEFTDYQKGIVEGYALQIENYIKRILAEQELKQSEEKYRKFFDADLAGDFKSSLDGRLLDCNEAFVRILEFDSKQHALSTNMHLLYSSDKNRKELYSRLSKEKTIELVEVPLVTIKGKQIIVLESMLAVCDVNGQVVGTSGFMIDMTQIKIADQALKESERRYRQLFYNMQNGFAFHEIILDKKGTPVDYRFLSVNPQFENLTGLKSIDLIGRTVKEVFPDTEKHWIDTYGTVALTQRAANFESYSKEIGKYFHVLAYSPEKMRFAVIIEDITEARKIEEKIRQLSRVVEQSPISVGITDLDANLIYVNPKYREAEGYSENEMIGHTPNTFRPDSMKAKDILRVLKSGNDWYGVIQNRNKHGEFFWEDVAISPLRDSIGKITNYIIIKEDITERIEADRELDLYRTSLENQVKARTIELDSANLQLQEEIRKQKEYELMLQQSLEKEKDLSELKTRFISTASHEFRTPLTSISLSAGLIHRYGKKWSEEKFSEHVNRIDSSIKYLTKLLDDVLTISRTESGKIVYEPEAVELKSFCKELMTEIAGYITDKHNLSFRYGLHKKDFMLDPKLLKFMLSNLLSNAFKYSPDGGEVGFHVSSSKSKLVFTINDEGVGLTDLDSPHMFEPFYRSSSSIDVQGTGLGLSIVKRAVDLHFGEISVNSTPGKGTTFTIKIPRITV